MTISDRMVDQVYSDLKSTCGGVRNDYFGLLYLEEEFKVPREKARNNVAFGGNDYGFDGFHFDRERRNFYLFQFKFTESHMQFKGSFERLINDGMARVFKAEEQDSRQNDVLLQLRSCLDENKNLVETVCIHFVFTGDPAEAEKSASLDKLREDLENKKHLVDAYFGRSMTLVVEFRSARTHKAGSLSRQRKTRSFKIEFLNHLEGQGPDGMRAQLSRNHRISLEKVC